MRHVQIAENVHAALAPIPRGVSESSAARSLLRELLAAFGTVGDIETRTSGQPYLTGRPDLAVSLSHSDGWAAAALGVATDVGVDVQVPQPVSPGLLRRCCRPATRAALEETPSRDREFAWIWSAQEACVKATGQGIAGLPWRIPVEAGQVSGTWQGIRWVSLRDRWPVPVSCAYRVAT